MLCVWFVVFRICVVVVCCVCVFVNLWYVLNCLVLLGLVCCFVLFDST